MDNNQTAPINAGSDGSTSHYGPATDPYEVIKVLDAWQVDAYQFQVIKYLARWRKKGGLADLKKAKFYLDRYIGIEQAKVALADQPLPSVKEEKNRLHEFRVHSPDKFFWTVYEVRDFVLALLNPRVTPTSVIQRTLGLHLTKPEAYALCHYHGIISNSVEWHKIWNSVRS